MRMGRLQQIVVYAVLSTVALSGLFWFVVHDLFDSEPNEFLRLLLATHGSSAYVLLLVLGSLLPLHVRSGWRRSKNVGTGLSVVLAMTILLITALLLYYGSEETRLTARWIHIIVGLLSFAIFPTHVVLGWKLRRAQAKSPDLAAATHRRPFSSEERLAN